jgi:S1-C subfamily serine protease
MTRPRVHRARLGALAAGLLLALGSACQGANGAQPGATAAATSAGPAGPVAAASPSAAASAAAAPAPPAPAQAGDFRTVVRDVANRVKPAVVQITNEQVQVDQFDQPFTVPAGVGSGVLYDGQGHILTNDHVVAGAQRLQVSLPDRRSFPARLVGGDAQTDLAVLQISGDNLPVVPLGDSRQLQVGDWVVAIGNALALPGGPTVTEGVVSALGRTVREPPDQAGPGQAGPLLFDVIQTDAPINPGNSGGPLLDLQGQVIGINTLVAAEAAPGVPAQGIGFAIAIATAKPIADQLVASGRVVHPYLGIRYVPLNPAIAVQLGTSATQGVVVAQVEPGSPAARAGLQPRDVITAVDGRPLAGESDLAEAINAHKPGDAVSLTVLRGGQQTTANVTLGELPAS